jgi:hypothetical protein
MTRDQWETYLRRLSHRTDLTTEDFDAILMGAGLLFDDSWMGDDLPYDGTDADLLARFPTAMSFAGMVHIHRLAQDDVGAQRELALFAKAIADAQMRHSIETTEPVMTRPYYPEEPANAD